MSQDIISNVLVETEGAATKRKRKRHGMYGTPTYECWRAMVKRCTNPNNQAYSRYNGRGIYVCDRWRFGDGVRSGFEYFLTDMGERPSSRHSIERIDNDGPYLPKNCRWATPEEQANNRRDNQYLTYEGLRLTVPQWSRRLKIQSQTIYNRLAAGWPVEKALSIPPRKPHEIAWNLKTQSLTEWARERGLTRSTLKDRLAAGWSVERTLSTPPRQYRRQGSNNP